MTKQEQSIYDEMLQYVNMSHTISVHMQDLLKEFVSCNSGEKYYNVVDGELTEVSRENWNGLSE